MAACRGVRIEWFSGCSHHGGAIFTFPEFRSQALFQHSTQVITLRPAEGLVRVLLRAPAPPPVSSRICPVRSTTYQVASGLMSISKRQPYCTAASGLTARAAARSPWLAGLEMTPDPLIMFASIGMPVQCARRSERGVHRGRETWVNTFHPQSPLSKIVLDPRQS